MAQKTQQSCLQVNTVQLEKQPEVDPVQVWKSLENTAFVTRYNTYTKPPVKLKDAVVPESICEGFEKLKEEFKDIISQGPSDIGVTDLAEMTINTKPDSIPHATHPYKLALQHQEFFRKEIHALLDTNVIVLSVSKYAAPCMVVPRKCKLPNSNLREHHRLVINYHALNRTLEPITCEKPNANGTLALVPQLKIENMWSALKGKSIFSAIDLRSSYHHILIWPEDRHKTAFVCDFGKFEFTQASFGITTSPDFLKDLMNKLFFSCSQFCLVYMDDLLCFSDSPEEHLEHLRIIFSKFQTAKLKVKLSKSDFFKQELESLVTN